MFLIDTVAQVSLFDEYGGIKHSCPAKFMSVVKHGHMPFETFWIAKRQLPLISFFSIL